MDMQLNVEVTDRDIPPYLELINGSWEVSGPNNGTAASMSSLGENGWIVTCPLLQYGDSIGHPFQMQGPWGQQWKRYHQYCKSHSR